MPEAVFFALACSAINDQDFVHNKKRCDGWDKHCNGVPPSAMHFEFASAVHDTSCYLNETWPLYGGDKVMRDGGTTTSHDTTRETMQWSFFYMHDGTMVPQ